MTFDLPGSSDHPSWRAAIATFLTYAIIIGVLTVLLFGLPYLAFTLL